MPVMIHCACAVIRMPTSTSSAMIRKATAPTPMAAQVLFARLVLNSDSVYCPAGSDPETMKMVADTTSDQPLRKPSEGCSARPTQE